MTRGTTIAQVPRAALLLVVLVLVLVLLLLLLLLLLLMYRSLHGEGRPELAVSTNPISLYVLNDGEVEERRSGVAPAWSPDGRRLARRGDHDGNVWVDDRAFSLGVGVDGRVEWTPDGRSLLFEGNGIRLLDVRTGTDRLVAPGMYPALSPDGRTVAYLRYTRKKRTEFKIGSTLQIVSLAGDKPRVLARTKGPPSTHFWPHPQWLADGTGVAVARQLATGGWALELVGLDGSRRVVVPRMGEEFALSPDGRVIAYQLTDYRKGLVVARPGERGTVYEFGRLLPKRYSMLSEYGGLTWSPDGREVAFYLGGDDISSASPDFLLRVYALNVRTGKIRRVAEIHGATSAQLAWNPHA